MKNIFFDFDGTLLDSRVRLFRLFQDITESDDADISFQDYWELKRSGKAHKVILADRLKYDEVKIDQFISSWMLKIEADYYLKLDHLYFGVLDILRHLRSKNVKIHLVTNRQKVKATHNQLDQLGIRSFFDKILITEQKKDKVSLIKESEVNINCEDIIVGDCGHDILVGKSLGIKSVGIAHGFQSYDVLSNYSPLYIVQDLMELKTKI